MHANVIALSVGKFACKCEAKNSGGEDMETKKTTGKKIWSLILTLAMVVGLLPQMTMPVQAEGDVYGVLRNDGIVYETNADNTQTDGDPIDKKSVKNIVTHLFAADDVDMVNGWEFNNCEVLTTVNMPKVTTIGEGAFNWCPALTSVEVPAVNLIENNAFAMDDALIHINMVAVETIDASAFANCEKLETVDMKAVTTIGEGGFATCVVLSKVNMPMVTSIGRGAFVNNRALTTVKMPEVTSIDDWAFANCRALTTVEMPKVISIGEEEFSQCPLLSNLTVGATPPTSVGAKAFEGCPSTTLTIAGGNTPVAVVAYNAVDDGDPREGYWYGWPLVVAVPATYTLTYNPNEGIGTMPEQAFTEAIEQALAKNIFTRTGYSCAGWNTIPDGTGTAYTDGVNYTATADIILYAQWTESRFKVSGRVEDGKNHPVSDANVELKDGNNTIGEVLKTDTDGCFTIGNVPNGTYNLVASKNDSSITTSVVVNNVDCALSNPIILLQTEKPILQKCSTNNPKTGNSSSHGLLIWATMGLMVLGLGLYLKRKEIQND